MKGGKYGGQPFDEIIILVFVKLLPFVGVSVLIRSHCVGVSTLLRDLMDGDPYDIVLATMVTLPLLTVSVRNG